MISPVELEKDIFKNKYNSLKKEYVADTYVIFEKKIKAGLSTCQSFIEKIQRLFKNKEPSNEELKESEKLDFLQYLYGILMQGFVHKDN